MKTDVTGTVTVCGGPPVKKHEQALDRPSLTGGQLGQAGAAASARGASALAVGVGAAFERINPPDAAVERGASTAAAAAVGHEVEVGTLVVVS